MSIEREGHFWEIHCDFCPYADSWDMDMFPNFHSLWTDCRQAGWTVELGEDGETWNHRCPSCVEKLSQDALDMFKPRGRC